VDIATVQLLEDALVGHSGDIEVHCLGVTFFSAAGVSALVRAHKACARRGSQLLLVDPSKMMSRVLALLKLETVLNLRNDGRVP
jgi:anti-anti-sigma factor